MVLKHKGGTAAFSGWSQGCMDPAAGEGAPLSIPKGLKGSMPAFTKAVEASYVEASLFYREKTLLYSSLVDDYVDLCSKRK